MFRFRHMNHDRRGEPRGTRQKRFLLGLAFALTPAVVAAPIAVLAIPESVRLPQAPDQDEVGATFSHWTHGEYGCFVCHPGLFPQQKKTFTHDDMDKGMYCGACHDGKLAFAPGDADCETCHRE